MLALPAGRPVFGASSHVEIRVGRSGPAILVTMITQAERAAARREEKLQEVERQVKEGSLTIRKLTAKERKRFPPQTRKAPAKAPRR